MATSAQKLKILEYIEEVYNDAAVWARSTSKELLFERVLSMDLDAEAVLVQMLQERLIVGVLEGVIFPTERSFNFVIHGGCICFIPAELFAIEGYLHRREWRLSDESIAASLDFAKRILKGET